MLKLTETLNGRDGEERFAAAGDAQRGNVALYLLVTMAPRLHRRLAELRTSTKAYH